MKQVLPLAITALARVEKGATVQEALASLLPRLATQQKRQLCTDLVYGLLRTELKIDFILSRLFPRPRKLPPAMYHVVALAVYALLFQERRPEYAVVDETVDFVRRRFGKAMAGVANGALRQFLRWGTAPQQPGWYQQKGKEWAGTCAYFSIPQVVADSWRTDYGEENALLLMARSKARPWSGLRVKLPAGEALLAAVRAQPGSEPIGKSGVAFPPGKLPEQLLGKALTHWQERGLLEWQAPASMLILEKLGLDCWQREVWDCCAGAGGKTLALQDAGVTVRLATDPSLKRLAHLKSRVDSSTLVAAADATSPPLDSWPGNILADVPCSGLGVLARRPDMRKRVDFSRRQEHFQLEILQSCASLLQPGSQLAYITCTLRTLENEGLINHFLKQHQKLDLVTSWQTPHKHPWLEGMFGALLRRK